MTSFVTTNDHLSWGRTVRMPHRVARPAWRDEVQHTLQSGIKAHPTILATGLRRSYGDTVLNPDGGIIDMTSVDRMIAFDPLTRRLRAEAGLSIDALLKFMVPRGFFIPVTAGTRFITLGGAVANDVHGKNHHRAGSFGCWVRRLGLLRSDGCEYDLGPDDETGLFAATIGGLGLTGLITWVEIELITIPGPMMKVETIAFDHLNGYFDLAHESDASHEYSVAWIDCLAKDETQGRGLFTRGRHAAFGQLHAQIQDELSSEPAFRPSIPIEFPPYVMNRFSLSAFNAFYAWYGKRKAGHSLQTYQKFFYPLDAISHWNRMYGKRGFYQYQSVVPPEHAHDATAEMLRTIAAAGEGSFLAVLKNFGNRPSPGLLSFPRAGTTLALDFPNRGRETLSLLDRLDAIVREAGGRLYPAKDGRMTKAMFRFSYPQWESFAVHVDPHFSSLFWQRVSS